MAGLFGFNIQRSKKDKGSEVTFTTPDSDDGSIEISGGSFFGQILDTDGRERSELDLIKRYRRISQQSECDAAIEDIINEGIVANQTDSAVQIDLERIPYPDKIKRKIRSEFDEVLRLLDFGIKGHDIFRRWYIDGRIYFHKVIDTKNPRKGITELRWIDTIKIKKVREIQKETDPKTAIDMIKKIDEYFIYNDKGIENAGLNLAFRRRSTDPAIW